MVMSLSLEFAAAARWLNLDALGGVGDPPAAEADSERPASEPVPAGKDAANPFAGLSCLLAAPWQRAAARALMSGDSPQASREEEARRVAEEGGLKSPGPQPPPSQKELDDLAAAVNAADDDAAVRIAADPRAMAIATPQQKAALIRKLSDGHTNAAEEAAIKQILLGCKSLDELGQVIMMAGGIQEIADELDDCDLQAVLGYAAQLAQKQEAAAERAILLLEQAESPEEFKRLVETLGGDQLKHKLPKAGQRNDLYARLDALGRRHGVAGVGFGMPPEKVAAYQAAMQKAIEEEDNDAIVKLPENSEAMKVATPAQKARMIAILQDGWTKDSQDMAIARILTSCGSKAEFDRVVDMAGGPKILDDVDYGEAKADINKLMGGFDRLDCADDRATARAHHRALMPPMVDELTRTRPPGDREVDGVLGPSPYSAEDLHDPATAAAARRQGEVRGEIGRQAYDLQGDPMARNKLAMKNRDRQLDGQPPLDYTSLVNDAWQVANDPAVQAEADRAIAEAEKQLGKLDDGKKQEIREKVLEQRLAGVAQQYGLTEQELKTLVTAKMGRLMQEGARAVAAAGVEHLTALQERLDSVERTQGRDSPEANRLRQSIARIGAATAAWAQRLQATGATVANLFKVPPSFAENLVSVLSVVGDFLAAAVNLIPGVGQAISGAYFGIKAIVGFATGDVLGAFKSLLSAVPAFSSVFGAATGAMLNAGAKYFQAGISAVEGIAKGNLMSLAGALGSIGGIALGKDPNLIGMDLGECGFQGELVRGVVAAGPQMGGVIDGWVRADCADVFDSMGRFLDEVNWPKPKEKP
jgi:hypothetical protein